MIPDYTEVPEASFNLWKHYRGHLLSRLIHHANASWKLPLKEVKPHAQLTLLRPLEMCPLGTDTVVNSSRHELLSLVHYSNGCNTRGMKQKPNTFNAHIWPFIGLCWIGILTFMINVLDRPLYVYCGVPYSPCLSKISVMLARIFKF